LPSALILSPFPYRCSGVPASGYQTFSHCDSLVKFVGLVTNQQWEFNKDTNYQIFIYWRNEKKKYAWFDVMCGFVYFCKIRRILAEFVKQPPAFPCQGLFVIDIWF